MRWTSDGWLVLDGGGTSPQETVPAPAESPEFLPKPAFRDDFSQKTLSLEYQSPRIPMTEHYLSLTARPGWLRMYSRSGLASKFSQSLIAVRLTEFSAEVHTKLEFEPEYFKQMAGLIVLYDTDNYLYLHISRDEDCGKCVTLLKAENKKYEYLAGYLPIPENVPVELRITVEKFYFTFSYRLDGGGWQELASKIDGSFLSDEACAEGWFTGTMAGICCQDLTGMGKYADFHYFEVKPQ